MKQVLMIGVAMLGSAAVACDLDDTAQMMMTEDDDAPEVYVQMDPAPVSKPFSVNIILCDFVADTIEIDAWMPAHQHGMNYAPRVEQTQSGYKASDFVFQMPGTWQFKAVVVKDDDQFAYTLDTVAK